MDDSIDIEREAKQLEDDLEVSQIVQATLANWREKKRLDREREAAEQEDS